MKTKFMKKILLSIFSAVFMLATAFGVLVAPLEKDVAQAEALSAWQTERFEMADGVSLKLADVNGLRFIARMDKEVYNFLMTTEDAKMGFVIAPKALMEEANGDYINMPKKVGGLIDKNKLYQDGDYYFANGCIINFRETSLKHDFTAVSYIQCNGTIRYTEYNNLARNNMYDTVNMAVLGGYAADIFEYETYHNWYGTESYPIVVETLEEYEKVINLVDTEQLDLSKCTVVLENDLEPSEEFTDTAKAPTVISAAVAAMNKTIIALPDSVTMPDAVMMVARIQDAKEQYDALSDTKKEQVTNYAKLESLLTAIKGYDRVYKHDADDGAVIPSYLAMNEGFVSTIGGTATVRQDSLYGNVLTATSDEGGRVALHFKNFPSVAKYGKIYFYVKTSIGCDIYMSDGITNNGWGENWKNSWSVEGLWCNADNWRLVEFYVSDGYVGTDFAIGFKIAEENFSFEISDIYAIRSELLPTVTELTIGQPTDSGATNEYGKVYNVIQEQWFIENNVGNTLGSFSTSKLANLLPAGHESYYFWIYNPTDTAYNFHLAGDCSGAWVDSKDTFALTPKAWTKITISAEDIESNKLGQWYAYILGGDGQGATKSGWQMSPIYAKKAEVNPTQEVTLDFGVRSATGETNEYGDVYNISREQYYIDNNINNTIGTLPTSQLANALPAGYEYFYFWMYNPTDTAYNFHLAGDCSGTWVDSKDTFALTPKAWTKITISAADIESNKLGQWYVYILGGDGAGAVKSGWQISTIYAGPDKEVEVTEIYYLDHADVKEAIAVIEAIPADLKADGAKAAVEAARLAYDQLYEEQKALISNYSKLTAAESALVAIEAASKVIALIDEIDPNNLDEDKVSVARNAYDALSEEAKGYVTNIAALEEYERILRENSESQARIDNVNSLIAALPDSVTMPDHLVFVARIEKAEAAYNALPDLEKEQITYYSKLRTLINAIKGYDAVHVQTVEGVDVIPSHVPNYTSTIGGTATVDYDGDYGNYLRVTPNAGGKVSIQFKNFPDVSEYIKLYFNIRVVGASCDIYLSDGIANDGWGENWKNTWSMTGFWANNGNWIQKEVEVSTGIFSSNWALGLRASETDVSFEITDIVGVKLDSGEKVNLTFGNLTDTGTKNQYGTVYNMTQSWDSANDLGSFGKGQMRNALLDGDDSLRFYIYNPMDGAVTLYFACEGHEWAQEGNTILAAQAWTEVIISPEMIDSTLHDSYDICICVKDANGTGVAKTSGWQISPLYSFSSGDAVDKVQARINELDTENVNSEKVQLTREAYEELSEAYKAAVDITKLVACEDKLQSAGSLDVSFIVNSATMYKIYADSTAKAAAEFIQAQILAQTGVTVPILNVAPTMDAHRYAIVLGYGLSDDNMAGLDGRADYSIQSTSRVVYVGANSADGYRMAALAFLKEVIGYEMFSDDCIAYGTVLDDLTGLNVVGQPFDYRQKQTYMTKTELYGMGLQSNTDLWIHSPEGWDMHNTLHYLPTATYQSAHPSWYYTYTDSINVSRTQICPTAKGSSSEFNAMVEAIAANMMVQINQYPDRENISFSIMDTGDNDDCSCTRCNLYDTLYGEGGFAAAWIDLMNAINAKIRETLPAERVLNIAFLAYRGTEKAPANIDSNGNVTLMKRYQINDDGSYVQTSEDLKCDEGVTVWLAPINALYAENFNHADNATHLATVKKWCALSSSVYVWLYGTNFKFYMYPYNTWQASAENYQIFYELGVKAVWSQSNETEATAFSDLKGYIDSKFMANVNADYSAVLDTYFTNYFGPAAEKMRSMFNAIVTRCDEIEAANDGLGRGIYDDLEYTTGAWFWEKINTYWTESELNDLVTLCNEAKTAVNNASLSDTQKTAILNRITKESLFPRYVLCTIYENTSDRAAFKADATALGLTLYREGDGLLSDLYSNWGV